MRVRRLGFGPDQRLWLPVFDSVGCFNVRRYDWLKVHSQKFLNYSDEGGGYGEAVLWPDVELGDEVYLFEGELDCLLARSLGLQNAICTTAGAGTWLGAWSRRLAGKMVHICYDIDDPGRAGAALVGRHLKAVGCSVVNVALPISEPEHGDFTDYGRSVAFDRESVLSIFSQRSEETLPTALRATSTPEFFGKAVGVRAVVSGKDLVPFQPPKVIETVCQYNEKKCGSCPLSAFAGRGRLELKATDSAVIKSVDATDAQVQAAIRQHIGVPGNCPGLQFETTATHQVWDVRLVNDLDTEEGREESTGEHLVRQAYTFVPLQANVPYDLQAVATVSPKSQHSLLVVTAAEGSQTSLEAYDPAKDEELLKIWEV